MTVYCGREGPEHDKAKSADDPRVIFEVLSAGTARTDLTVKLAEYKALPSVDAIVFVDVAGLILFANEGFLDIIDVAHPGISRMIDIAIISNNINIITMDEVLKRKR